MQKDVPNATPSWVGGLERPDDLSQVVDGTGHSAFAVRSGERLDSAVAIEARREGERKSEERPDELALEVDRIGGTQGMGGATRLRG